MRNVWPWRNRWPWEERYKTQQSHRTGNTDSWDKQTTTDKNILRATVGLEVKKNKKITLMSSIGEFFILNDDFKERPTWLLIRGICRTSTMRKMEGIAESSHKNGVYCTTQNVMEVSNFWMNKSKIDQYTWIDIQNAIWIGVLIIKPQKDDLNLNPACSASLWVNEWRTRAVSFTIHILKRAWHSWCFQLLWPQYMST